MGLEHDDFALGEGFGQTRWSPLVVAEGNNVGRDLADDAQKIAPLVAETDLGDLGQLRQRSFALLLGLVGIVPLDAPDVLIAGDYDEQFVAQRSRLRDKGAVTWVQIIKSAAAQYASFIRWHAGLSNTQHRGPWQKCGQSD